MNEPPRQDYDFTPQVIDRVYGILGNPWALKLFGNGSLDGKSENIQLKNIIAKAIEILRERNRDDYMHFHVLNQRFRDRDREDVLLFQRSIAKLAHAIGKKLISGIIFDNETDWSETWERDIYMHMCLNAERIGIYNQRLARQKNM